MNLQDVYNSCYGILSTSQDSKSYPETLMLSFINKAQNDICYGNVVNLQTNERIDKQALTFLEATKFYNSHMWYTLPSDATTGSSTLTITNTFSSSGFLWINGNMISYTGNNGTTITGIPTSWQLSIQFNHRGGSQVFQLESLPTDFWQLSRIFYTPASSMVRNELISVDSRDLVNSVPGSYIYQYFNNYGSNFTREFYYSMMKGKYVLFLLNQVDNQPVMMDYQVRPTQLENDIDILTIPDDYALSTIPYIATAEMMANRGEMAEAIRLQNFGFQNVKNMYQFYATQRQELMYWNRVRTASDGYMAI